MNKLDETKQYNLCSIWKKPDKTS